MNLEEIYSKIGGRAVDLCGAYIGGLQCPPPPPPSPKPPSCKVCITSVSAVKKIIEGELMKADDDGQVDDYDNVEITFHQWTNSDRAEPISCTLPLDEFIELLCEQLDEIASYS